MFKNQIKTEYLNIKKLEEIIDNSFTDIKISLHTIEKLGINMEELYNQLENVGIEFYKFKIKTLEKYKKNGYNGDI